MLIEANEVLEGGEVRARSFRPSHVTAFRQHALAKVTETEIIIPDGSVILGHPYATVRAQMIAAGVVLWDGTTTIRGDDDEQGNPTYIDMSSSVRIDQVVSVTAVEGFPNVSRIDFATSSAVWFAKTAYATLKTELD